MDIDKEVSGSPIEFRLDPASGVPTTALYLRPHYLTPVLTRNVFLPPALSALLIAATVGLVRRRAA